MAGRSGNGHAGDLELRRSLLFAALISLLLAPLPWLPGWQMVEGRLFDLLSTSLPLRPAAYGAVVVAIDEPSFAEFQRQWPWPRSLHGRLIESLRAAGAKAIALDIIFAEPAADPQEDRKLAAALGPDVVLAGEISVIESPQAEQTLRIEPLPAFVARGAHVGIASVQLDGDQVLRRLPRGADGFGRVLAGLSGAESREPPAGALIQYFGPPRSYPTVSYYQALDPAKFLPPDYFRDKIVVIGLSLQNTIAAGKKAPDSFATSFTASTGQMTAGPEMQATIFDNYARGLFIEALPMWLSVAAAALAVFLAAINARGMHPWRAALTVPAGVLGVTGLSFLALRFGRLWLPPVLPSLGIVLAVAVHVVRGYLGEQLARRQITRAFEHYLAPSLVAQLARDPAQLKLGGERRRLTVLFCDIRGFTAIAERLKDDPERLTALVNRVLTVLSEAVLATGGTIDKYIGDCLMGFWNAPLEDPEHAQHALAAAMAMQEAAADLNRRLASEGESDIQIAIGVGINTGDCVVGNMGSESRFDYTAIGDTVNLAARLEGLCKDFNVGIVLGAATVAELRDRIAVRSLGVVSVSGRSEPVKIFTPATP